MTVDKIDVTSAINNAKELLKNEKEIPASVKILYLSGNMSHLNEFN